MKNKICKHNVIEYTDDDNGFVVGKCYNCLKTVRIKMFK
jgi:hypothetical protein